MGLMKENLMTKITEFAKRVGVPEKDIYNNEFYYSLAVEYAERELNKAMKRVLYAAKTLAKERRKNGYERRDS